MSEMLNDENKFDVLGDVLTTLRFRGSIFFRSTLASPWGITLPNVGYPRFHIGLSGSCYVGTKNYSPVKISEGEIAMLPCGGEHWIADHPGRKLITSEKAGRACELGNPLFQEGEITNHIMCGLVNFDQDVEHPILDSLPEVIHFPEIKSNEPIWMTVALMNSEVHRIDSFDNPIIDRLTEVLFLQLLYFHAQNSEGTVGFLAALKDRRLHQAISLIHKTPNFDWTLESLGSEVGMSRATLVRHFESAIGVSPMSYIRRWRITKAYNLVKYSSTPLEQIATAVGFSSAGSLNKAFQRYYQYTPAELRRINTK